MRIAIYDVQDALNSRMVVETLHRLSARLKDEGHSVHFIPVTAGPVSRNELKKYYENVDLFFSYAGNYAVSISNGNQVPLQDLMADQPFKFVMFMPIPLASRPAIIKSLHSKYSKKPDSADHASWVYFDPDFLHQHELFFDRRPSGVKTDVLFKSPGVMPPENMRGIKKKPDIFFFASIKSQKAKKSKYDQRGLLDCLEYYLANPEADLIPEMMRLLDEDVSSAVAGSDFLDAVHYVLTAASNIHRVNLFKQLVKTPCTIYTSVADMQALFPSGLAMHPECKIHSPQPYLETFHAISPGDLVVCPPVWGMRNVFTDRCLTSMYRGAIPLVPDCGDHVPVFNSLEMGDVFFNVQRAASITESIDHLLGSKSREEYALKGHEFVVNNCGFDQFYKTIRPVFDI